MCLFGLQRGFCGLRRRGEEGGFQRGGGLQAGIVVLVRRRFLSHVSSLVYEKRGGGDEDVFTLCTL